jgi:hypothetical protein
MFRTNPEASHFSLVTTFNDRTRRKKNSPEVEEDNMAFSALLAFLVFLAFLAFLAFSAFSAFLAFLVFSVLSVL